MDTHGVRRPELSGPHLFNGENNTCSAVVRGTGELVYGSALKAREAVKTWAGQTTSARLQRKPGVRKANVQHEITSLTGGRGLRRAGGWDASGSLGVDGDHPASSFLGNLPTLPRHGEPNQT